MVFKRRKTRVSVYSRKAVAPKRARKTTGSTRNVRKKSALSRFGSNGKVRLIGFFLKISVVLGLLGYLIYYLFFSGTFVITETALFEDDIRIDNSFILSEVNSHKGEVLFGVDTREIVMELKQKYPEINQINVKKKMPNKLHVYVTTHPIVANLVVHVDEFQRKYLINEIGVIDTTDQEDPNLPYIIMKREQAYNSKERVFEKEQLSKIRNATILFEQKFNMKVLDVLFLEKAREFHLRTEKDFYIWLDLEQDYKSQLSRLKAAEQKLNIHSTPLQYIDLRIAGNKGEKVIFRRR